MWWALPELRKVPLASERKSPWGRCQLGRVAGRPLLPTIHGRVRLALPCVFMKNDRKRTVKMH